MTTINKTLVSVDNNYFDLFEYNANLKMVYVAAAIAASTAWRIDTMIVGNSRQVLKRIKEENFNQGGYQAMSEVLTALEDAEFAEQSFHEIGTHAEGILETIRALNAQRDQWHDEAARLVSMCSDYQGNPQVYVIPDIEMEFKKDISLRVNETTQRRLKTRSERIATALESPELAQAHFERSMQRKEDDNRRIASTLKEQSDLARFMFTMTLRTDPIGAAMRPKGFYDLPVAAQRILLDNAGSAAARCDERAASDRNMSETEYDMISLTAIKAMTDLKKVASSKRFTLPAMEASQV